LSGPVDAMVRRSANEAGFAGARIQGQGPMRASVAIDAARPQAFFAWIAQLEQSGVVVDRLRARANNDRTVTAELVLRARGGR
jgi:general secretion pathway protein M